MSGHYLGTFTLDEVHQPGIVAHRLKQTGRIDRFLTEDQIRLLATALCMRLRYKGPNTTSEDPRSRFQYVATESDLDQAVNMLREIVTKTF